MELPYQRHFSQRLTLKKLSNGQNPMTNSLDLHLLEKHYRSAQQTSSAALLFMAVATLILPREMMLQKVGILGVLLMMLMSVVSVVSGYL